MSARIVPIIQKMEEKKSISAVKSENCLTKFQKNSSAYSPKHEQLTKHRRNNGADKDAVRLIISFGAGVSEPDEFLKKSKSRSNGSRKALRKESTKTAMKAEIEIIAISSM